MNCRLSFGVLALFFLSAIAFAAEDKKEEAKAPAPGSIAGAAPILEEGAKDAGVKPETYWLGVECGPVPKMLQVHLGLPENQGLLITQVVLDGPAAKAGLVASDILMAAGEKKLAHPADLVEAVNQAKGKPLALELIHAGKTKYLRVTPELRPQLAPEGPAGQAVDESWRQIEQWIQKMRPGGAMPPMPLGQDLNALKDTLKFRFLGPGAILSQSGATAAMALPGNLSISISKTGNLPAQIVVKRDNQQWEVTEKELDKLPADIRPHVERMLSGISISGASTIFDFGPNLAPPPKPTIKKPQRGPAGPTMDQRLEKLNRQVEEMRKQLDTLKKAEAKP
jgi:membrane-associated protease RseP (regulator of RpoE activity)